MRTSGNERDGSRVPARGPTRRQVLAGLGAVGLVGPSLLTGCGDGEEAEPPPFEGQPNLLVIVADDMRYDWLPETSNVRRLIGAEGRTFTQGRVNVALCQPSRVGMVTGQLSKHNGVLDIGYGGLNFDMSRLIGAWLADAGYRCGLVGKFINGLDWNGGIDPPPGFTFWRQWLVGPGGSEGGSDVVVREEDRVTEHHDLYATDYLAQETTRFIRDGDGPWACFVTPTEPHAPAQPRPDLVGRYADLEWPIVDEQDVRDKPPWIQRLPAPSKVQLAMTRQAVRGALSELAAVDELVGKLVGALGEEELRRTVVFFTSDNGIHIAEHRRIGAAIKGGPYDVGLRVPLVVRGPGFEPGPDVTAPSMVFQDLAATLADLAGATPTMPHQLGVSLKALCARPDDHRQRVLLHEIATGYPATGDGITTGPDHELGFRKLFRYPSVRSGLPGPRVYEAYDLDTDPDELTSWAEDASRRAERDRLEAILDELLAAP